MPNEPQDYVELLDICGNQNKYREYITFGYYIYSVADVQENTAFLEKDEYSLYLVKNGNYLLVALKTIPFNVNLLNNLKTICKVLF
ncbi:hypothetical protein PPL_11444 [Heterostelium album PN500]|uniref:Uncharacterized protein n=1 Tax=Heterostelium pallidum (strain ATCC 26659 / Pp 5 / PN500) TaxID=670386 RepID=D3BTF0_HETP5|nr:hypothetical protein PPL_11444 [Heterostelium album PN500]EFA75367.1 hypothetical protein PPL_11444 [Heterostelium album PN500]|eukprot:XP_020427501.1 hypothetical protein PPL_11444 [Heterostelium album PN500]